MLHLTQMVHIRSITLMHAAVHSHSSIANAINSVKDVHLEHNARPSASVGLCVLMNVFSPRVTPVTPSSHKSQASGLSFKKRAFPLSNNQNQSD